MIEYIRYALVGIVSIGVTLLLQRKFSSKKPKTKNGNQIVRIPKYYLFVSIILGVAGPLYILYSFADEENWMFSFRIIYGIFGTFLVYGSISSALLQRNHRVEILSDGILINSLRNKSTFTTWHEIESVRYKVLTSSYIITCADSKSSMHESLIGINPILDTISEKTGLIIKRKENH
ncbi:MAG TPA: hypothetical protein DIW47_09635 [Bacteroidetes bacterium]|nr:hypothetical protein [Bacteroidota bacterium]